VVERPSIGNRFTHLMARGYVEHVNLRPDMAIRGKQRNLGWEGRRE
jgi:hypothetical protein